MHSVDSLWCFRNEDQSCGLQSMRFLEKRLASNRLPALNWSKQTVKRTCVKQEKNTNLEIIYYNFKYIFKHAHFYVYKNTKSGRTGCLCARLSQVCPSLSHPTPCSLSVSSVHGILQQESWSGLLFPSLRLNSLVRPQFTSFICS